MGTGAPSIVALRQGLERDAPAWAAREGADLLARRRLIAATFTLDVAHGVYAALQQAHGLSPSQGLYGTGLGDLAHVTGAWIELGPMVEWACAWLRKAPPTDPLEHDWFLASVQLFRDFHDPSVSNGWPAGTEQQYGGFPGHLGHAASRFPDEPWFRVVSAERQSLAEQTLAAPTWAAAITAWYQHAPVRDFLGGPAQLAGHVSDLLEIRRRMTPLEAALSVRAEVHLHLGCVALLCGEHDRARQYFDDVDSWTTDPCTQYLGHFLRGRVDELDGRREDAERGYRAALTILPLAQSGLTALGVSLALDGQMADAAQLAREAVAAPTTSVDPWVEFSRKTGCSHWSAFMGVLRQGLRTP
jgi:hypothetical protein